MFSGEHCLRSIGRLFSMHRARRCAQEQLLRIFEVQDLLEEPYEQKVEILGLDHDGTLLPFLHGFRVPDHERQQRVGSGAKALFERISPCLEAGIGNRGILEPAKRHAPQPFTFPMGVKRTTGRLSPASVVAATTASMFL